jgi:hypothetical protein
MNSIYSNIFLSSHFNSKEVQEYIEMREKRRAQIEKWLEVQADLSHQISQLKFPSTNEYEVSEEEEELGMFFKMDDPNACLTLAKFETSPQSVADVVSPVSHEHFVAPKLVIEHVISATENKASVEVESHITPVLLSSNYTAPESKVVEEEVKTSDALPMTNEYIFSPVREGLLSKLFREHDARTKVQAPMPASYSEGSYSSYSDLDFVSEKAAAHLDLDTPESKFANVHTKAPVGFKPTAAEVAKKNARAEFNALFSTLMLVGGKAENSYTDSSNESQSNDVGLGEAMRHVNLSPHERLQASRVRTQGSYDSADSDFDQGLWQEVDSDNDEKPRDSLQFPISL